LWDKFSLAQLGYDLSFIRHSKSGNIAILLCDDNAATISDDGEVRALPSIVIRA
jgi:hypothetical protein